MLLNTDLDNENLTRVINKEVISLAACLIVYVDPRRI